MLIPESVESNDTIEIPAVYPALQLLVLDLISQKEHEVVNKDFLVAIERDFVQDDAAFDVALVLAWWESNFSWQAFSKLSRPWIPVIIQNRRAVGLSVNQQVSLLQFWADVNLEEIVARRVLDQFFGL